jgi:hypothetical protein
VIRIDQLGFAADEPKIATSPPQRRLYRALTDRETYDAFATASTNRLPRPVNAA